MIRFLDILLSLLAIIIIGPFMLPIMIIQKCTGEHYIFYTQNRVGKGRKIFPIIKFATMLKNSPNLPGGLITAPNDSRLLPLGNFLRKSKINELPQLFNVLIGQMSLVGYRPFAVKHYELYSSEVKQCIEKIQPGITGLGSIIFRNEEELLHGVKDRDYFHDNVITPYKGKIESWYVENRTVVNYLLILFYTIVIVISPNNDSWKKVFKDLPPIPDELKAYIK